MHWPSRRLGLSTSGAWPQARRAWPQARRAWPQARIINICWSGRDSRCGPHNGSNRTLNTFLMDPPSVPGAGLQPGKPRLGSQRQPRCLPPEEGLPVPSDCDTGMRPPTQGCPEAPVPLPVGHPRHRGRVEGGAVRPEPAAACRQGEKVQRFASMAGLRASRGSQHVDHSQAQSGHGSRERIRHERGGAPETDGLVLPGRWHAPARGGRGRSDGHDVSPSRLSSGYAKRVHACDCDACWY